MSLIPTRLAQVSGIPGLMWSSSGVSTNAGQTTVTATPWRRASTRSARLSETTAALTEEYGIIAGTGRIPAREPVLTMCP